MNYLASTVHRVWVSLVSATILCSACAPAIGTPPAETQDEQSGEIPPRRAILVSFDALSEARIRNSLPPEAVPNLLAIFDSAACAEYAVPAFPSTTAPGHASIWTGAYGDVTGVTANSQPRLPRDEHTLLDLTSGFSADVLRAEPFWITAGRAGLSVVGHHVTQAPDAPGFHAIEGERSDRLEARRAEARHVLDLPGVRVLNGYNRFVSPHRVFDETTAPLRPASGWANVEQLGGVGVPLLETGWEIGTDSVFALFYGEDEYSAVLIASSRDAALGVIAAAMPAEQASPHGRPLARYFSEAIEVPAEGGRVYPRVRLFELAPDASSFLIYQPALYAVEGNRPEVAAAYDAAVRGWVGNAALGLLADSGFGPTRLEGGDGTAEARYLESVEYVTRQYMRGVEWAWNTVEADLLLDYFPLGDAVDHALYGYLDPNWPGYDAEAAAHAQLLRRRAWEFLDLRLAHLRRLAAEAGAALFIAGDHGMRATWRIFRPNAALRQAGLLVLDDEGEIDLSRTRALSPNGYWVDVNRTARKSGIVPPAEEAEVLAAAERALLAVRDSAGNAIVTQIYRATEHPELGLGGPTGGDLYYGVAPGVRWTPSARGDVIEPAEIRAGHGFPSVSPDMWTVFCAEGVGPDDDRTIPAVRTIDIAPTLAGWMGIPAPADARGSSVLHQLQGNR